MDVRIRYSCQVKYTTPWLWQRACTFLNVTLGAEISAGSVNFDVTQTEVE